MYILKTVQMVNIIVNGSLRRNVKPREVVRKETRAVKLKVCILIKMYFKALFKLYIILCTVQREAYA